MTDGIFTSGNLVLLVPVIALALDLMLGDPPNRWHPVAWLGGLIYACKRLAPQRGRFLPLLYGMALSIIGAVIVGGVAFLIALVFRLLPLPVMLVMEAALLKLCLSMRGLTEAAREVHNAMIKGDLDEGRRLASWHLVSRDTSLLGRGHVASATIESVAENLCDGIVGPIFWYALAGLPGAWIYRFINTADSILGYRTADLEWVGKIPARLDDIANFIPARLSALLLLVAAPLMRIDPIPGIRVCLRDHKLTSSPNAGWPMSAMAGILGVKLEKIGHYCLDRDALLPGNSDILCSTSLMQIAAWLSTVMGLIKLI